MVKKKLATLNLMVKDQDDPMKDFVWATDAEVKEFENKGYRRLKSKFITGNRLYTLKK